MVAGRVRLWSLIYVAGFLGASIPIAAARTGSLVFLSTQLAPATEAQEMRHSILAEFPHPVDFITLQPRDLSGRIEAGQQDKARAADVVGATHGELLGLADQHDLVPLDDFADRSPGEGIPDPLVMLGKLGTAHQFYLPWMQAGYIMVASKKALPYLPSGADIDALSYDQLAAWAAAIRAGTGRRLLGFPAGPRGLIVRFFEGFLYPSYTAGVVMPFRSQAAKAMWQQFASLWKDVNPSSETYDFMLQPVLSGDVWIAFDHIARVLPVLRAKPDDFVAFPAPAGPRGRGYMPVFAGLGVVKGTPDRDGAKAFIDYLRQPETQIAMARGIGFLPAIPRAPLEDLDPGLRMAAAALAKMRSAKDALLALPPIGFGAHDGDLDTVFTDTFHRIVLHGEAPQTVLNQEAGTLQHLIMETGARCWRPDPPSTGPCQVQ